MVGVVGLVARRAAAEPSLLRNSVQHRSDTPIVLTEVTDADARRAHGAHGDLTRAASSRTVADRERERQVVCELPAGGAIATEHTELRGRNDRVDEGFRGRYLCRRPGPLEGRVCPGSETISAATRVHAAGLVADDAGGVANVSHNGVLIAPYAIGASTGITTDRDAIARAPTHEGVWLD